MERECPRHPGASTIGSQLLNETAPMVSKSWQPSHEPPWETHITELINMKSIETLSQSFDESCQYLVGSYISYISRKTPVYNDKLLIIISYGAQPIRLG